jgi:hypothetical protein
MFATVRHRSPWYPVIALSQHQQGFESPTGRQGNQKVSGKNQNSVSRLCPALHPDDSGQRGTTTPRRGGCGHRLIWSRRMEVWIDIPFLWDQPVQTQRGYHCPSPRAGGPRRSSQGIDRTIQLSAPDARRRGDSPRRVRNGSRRASDSGVAYTGLRRLSIPLEY